MFPPLVPDPNPRGDRTLSVIKKQDIGVDWGADRSSGDVCSTALFAKGRSPSGFADVVYQMGRKPRCAADHPCAQSMGSNPLERMSSCPREYMNPAEAEGNPERLEWE